MRITGGAGEGFSQVKAGYGITFLVMSVPSGEASLRLLARSTNITATGAYPKMFPPAQNCGSHFTQSYCEYDLQI